MIIAPKTQSALEGPYCAGGGAWGRPDELLLYAARLSTGRDLSLPVPGRLGIPLLLEACAWGEAHHAVSDSHAG